VTEPQTGHPGGHHAAQPEQTRSLGEIIGEVTSDLSDLFKQEVELAKVELKQEATRAGKGAGMLAGAGLAAVLLLVFASLTVMYLLDNVMPVELAALIVTLLWAAVAGVLALVGRKNLKKSNPQLPVTQQTLKEDAQWARAQRS
jgi:uncharacterized membrane protein YqjE